MNARRIPTTVQSQRAQIMVGAAAFTLAAALLGLGLLTHLALDQSRLPGAGAGALSSPAADPSAPATGGALTIYIINTGADATSFQDFLLFIRCSPVPSSGCGTPPLILTGEEVAASSDWLPTKYGQQLTVVDLRTPANAMATPNPAMRPTYVLAPSKAVVTTLIRGGLQQQLGMGVLLADSPSHASNQALQIAAENALRLAAGEDPIVLMDLR